VTAAAWLCSLLAPAALGWGSTAARAQILPEPSTTTTTSVPPFVTTTTTTTKVPTTTARTTASTAATTTTTRAPAPTTTTSTTFPPGLLALANSVKRSPPNSTFRVLAALAPLQQLGFTPQQAAMVGLGQFPVAGPATFADDWWEPRPGPIPRLHEGDDIVAATGTPLRAPADGTLKYDTSDPAGYGVAAIVTMTDGTYFLMGHLSATVSTLTTGSVVKQGDVVGFVGATGDATGPHCHFEIHPRGGAGVDPKPYLDRFLADALAAAPQLISAVRASKSPPTSVAAAVPVPVVLPNAGEGVLSVVPAGLPGPGSGSGSRPYPLAGAGLAALIGVVGWLASARRRQLGDDGPLEAAPVVELSPVP